MSVVVDASLVFAGLVVSGPDGDWAADILASGQLLAPHLMQAEVANVLRRAVLSGSVGREVASMAYGNLLELPVELVSYRPLGERVWQMYVNVTAYDAWYVALAEELSAPLATLDRRLVGVPGPTCTFLTPPERT